MNVYPKKAEVGALFLGFETSCAKLLNLKDNSYNTIIQGDIIGLTDISGTQIVTYNYDNVIMNL